MDSGVGSPITYIGFCLHHITPENILVEGLNSKGINLSIFLEGVSLPYASCHRSPTPLSPEFLNLLDSQKVYRVFWEARKLGCTFLMSDEVDIIMLLDLESRDRQLRSARLFRICTRC